MAEPLSPMEQEIVLGGDCPRCGGSLELESNTCKDCGTSYVIRFFPAIPN